MKRLGAGFPPIGGTLDTIGGHLRGQEIRHRLNRWSWLIVATATACSCSRHLLFPGSALGSPWMGFFWALWLVALVLLGGALFLLAQSVWRRRCPFATAQAVDKALATKDAITSAYLFEAQGQRRPLEELTCRRAKSILSELRLGVLFPLEPLGQSRRRRALLCSAVAAALLAGGLDGRLWTAYWDKSRDVSPAAQLEQTIAKLEELYTDEETSEEHVQLASLAREAASAAKRGDHRAALENLGKLRAAQQSQAVGARAISDSLDSVFSEVPITGDQDRSDPVHQSLRSFANDLEDGTGALDAGERESLSRSFASAATKAQQRTSERGRDKNGTGRVVWDFPGGWGEADFEPQVVLSALSRSLRRASSAIAEGHEAGAAAALRDAAEQAQRLAEQREKQAQREQAVSRLVGAASDLERQVHVSLVCLNGRHSCSQDEVAHPPPPSQEAAPIAPQPQPDVPATNAQQRAAATKTVRAILASTPRGAEASAAHRGFAGGRFSSARQAAARRYFGAIDAPGTQEQ